MKNKNCDKIVEELISKMEDHSMNEEHIQELFSKHPDCKDQIDSVIETWNLLAEIESPMPSSRMDDLFYENLDKFVQNNNQSTGAKIVDLFRKNRNMIIGIAVAASLFFAGMLVGPFYNQDNDSNGKDINEVNEYYTFTSYSEDQLSSNRLEDVNKIKDLPQLNQKIIDALNQALLKDPNINVRLSAIEAMTHFADNPQVRQNLIEAIPFQTSPIVQLTLAEVMIELQETRSKEAWQNLLKKNGMEEDVKKQLEETLEVII